ncbi:MAG: hypothetical protein JXQ75_11760, partial [Phycisphaerae bacterium]|nr:hypothetical protein [Phycisphaerae bacterium]
KRENSGSETPFLTVKTTGETPVPQFCHGLIAFHGWRHLWHRRLGGGFTGFGARATVAGKREMR